MRSWATLLLVAALGCSGPIAIITRPDGPPIEAEIDSSDASTLRLRGERDAILRLGQSQVSDIDHPGNETALAGLAFAAVGTLFLLAPLFHQSFQPDTPGPRVLTTCVGMLGLSSGLSIFGYNIWVWKESRAHARAFEDARPPKEQIAPAAPGEPEVFDPL